MRRRQHGDGFGNPLPIAWGEMAAYLTLTGSALLPWEIDVIEAIDDAYLSAIAKARDHGKGSADAE